MALFEAVKIFHNIYTFITHCIRGIIRILHLRYVLENNIEMQLAVHNKVNLSRTSSAAYISQCCGWDGYKLCKISL